MGFGSYALCMYCVLSSADLARFVASNPLMELPLRGPLRVAFYLFTFPTSIGVVALPIYALFRIAWWQVIVGFLLSSIAVGSFTRLIRRWHYLWAIGFSVAAILVFMVSA